MPSDEAMSWPVASSTDLHRDDWVVALRADQVSRPGHPDETFRRLVIEDPGAVVVLAIDEDDRAVVVQHYRHPAQMRLVELPAGILDQPREDPLVAAQRELREEAALQAVEWQLLTTTFATPGKSQERHLIYLARGLSEVERGFELQHEEADMTVSRVAVDDLVDAVLDGRLHDGPLVIAVLAFDALRRRGRA